MGPLELPAAVLDPASRSPSSRAVTLGPAAGVEDPYGVFALSYTRGWLAGGPCVNPSGPGYVPNHYFDQEPLVFMYPCSPVTSEDDCVEVFIDEPESPDEVQVFVKDDEMAGRGIQVIFADRA